MFNWIKNRRAAKELARVEAERLALQKKVQELKELEERQSELKEVLIKAGIHPFNWCNRAKSGDFVRMYGVLSGRLIEATMGRNGGLVVEYVKGGADA